MIYSIVGTHYGLREKGNKEIKSLGEASHHIYSEQVSELEALVNATSLFGDVIVVFCIQLGESATSKEELKRLLEPMSTSATIFVIDEPFADVHLVNRLQKVSKKLFDAREEKIKDVSVFALCDSFVARDKKQAWVDFMRIKKGDNAEAIQGALWWKFQTEWGKVKDGRKSLFTKDDCERIGGALVRSSILAHRGQKDLMLELERIILTL
jgi:hypothetical protein